MHMKPDCLYEESDLIVGTWERSAEENLYTEDRGSNRKMEKTVQWGNSWAALTNKYY
jgi:hypothetical protein